MVFFFKNASTVVLGFHKLETHSITKEFNFGLNKIIQQKLQLEFYNNIMACPEN